MLNEPKKIDIKSKVKHPRIFLGNESSAIFEYLRKFSEKFGKFSETFVRPSDNILKIFGNLPKIVKNIVISRFIINRILHGCLEI